MIPKKDRWGAVGALAGDDDEIYALAGSSDAVLTSAYPVKGPGKIVGGEGGRWKRNQLDAESGEVDGVHVRWKISQRPTRDPWGMTRDKRGIR